MAFTIQAFVADPTLSISKLANYVANPTLTAGNIRLPAFASDATLLTGGLKLPNYTTDIVRLPQITAAGVAAQIGNNSGVLLPFIQAAGIAAEGATGSTSSSKNKIPQSVASGTADSAFIVSLPQIVAAGVGEEWAVQVTQQLPHIIASGYATQGGISKATLLQIIAAAQGYSGVVGSSSVRLPLMVAAGQGYVPAIGFSVQLSIPLIIATGTGRSSGNTWSTIVMHTESQALTEYDNYHFNSFAKFNGVYLGAGDDGIFALTGADDDGVFIDAYARVGITDYGTSHLKRADRLYVGYRTDGNLILRVITEDLVQRDYLLKATGKSGIHGNHIRVGKGVEARYWQFEIRNKDGADFELDMIEVKPTVLSRRIGGGNA